MTKCIYTWKNDASTVHHSLNIGSPHPYQWYLDYKPYDCDFDEKHFRTEFIKCIETITGSISSNWVWHNPDYCIMPDFELIFGDYYDVRFAKYNDYFQFKLCVTFP